MICEDDVPEVAVAAFSQKHNLSQEKQLKLMAVVREQLASMLPRILEEEPDKATPAKKAK